MSSPIGVSEWARYEASNRSVARERTLVRDQAMQGSQRSSLPIITHRMWAMPSSTSKTRCTCYAS